MEMTRSLRAMLAAGLGLAVTACMPAAERVSVTPVAIQPTGVEGTWIDQQGVGQSTFAGGVFETMATDTGNKLAEGSYRYRDQSSIEITLTSLIQQTTSQVNCSLVNPTQLNCTASSGSQFILTRRA